MPSSESRYQAQLQTIARELTGLIGQSLKEVAQSLLTTLARATGARSGRLFLTDDRGHPEYCLVLASGQLEEYDETSCPPIEQQALVAWIYRQRRGILVGNTTTHPLWPSWAGAQETISGGSALAVPILIATQPMGALALVADEPDHFTQADLTLITQLMDQAAVVLENARLKAVLVRQQNALNALRQTTRTVNTSLEFDQILRAVLDQAMQALPYTYGTIFLLEGRRLRLVAATGAPDVEKHPQRTFSATDIPGLFHALNQGDVVIKGSEQQPPDLEAFAFPQPVRSWVIAPLIARQETLGGLILASPLPHVGDERIAPLVHTFADHIATAVAKNRLMQETDRRLRELAFLNETGQAITSTLNLDRVLHLLLERVRHLLQIDAASIALRDEQTGQLVFEAASGAGAATMPGVRLNPGQGIAGWVAETGKPLVVHDAYSDARFFAEVDRKTGVKTQAILCTPIVLKGQVVGVIEALNPSEIPFDERAIELLNALAGLAATAIDNARLFARVRSAEARYEGLFEDSANPIIITDLRGTIADINRNACTLLGQTKEASRGMDLSRFCSLDDSVNFGQCLESIQMGEETVFQTTIPGSGQPKIVEMKGKQILVKDIPLIQWIGRDISAEIELERTREDMVRMIIHDLRNPLANIMNCLDVLREVIGAEDNSVSWDDLIKIARRSGQRMHQLISTILDISRLESGQGILNSRPTDLIRLLNDAAEFVKPQADMRDIRLTLNLPPSLPWVEIDKDMISRVVINLLDNATKFTQMGGATSVTAYALGSTIEVAVSDNGPGIPADQLQKVFEKFTRVRLHEGPQGTGLGLAFCQLAIKAHGGRIWADSAPDQGTTVRFTLPIYPANQET